jgi:hypothetical protein
MGSGGAVLNITNPADSRLLGGIYMNSKEWQ